MPFCKRKFANNQLFTCIFVCRFVCKKRIFQSNANEIWIVLFAIKNKIAYENTKIANEKTLIYNKITHPCLQLCLQKYKIKHKKNK